MLADAPAAAFAASGAPERLLSVSAPRARATRARSARRRLLESTFQLDVLAAREYCEADERWAPAVAFLDAGDRAGWGLLAAMLTPEWRRRPTAASCLVHPFLAGKAAGASAAG